MSFTNLDHIFSGNNENNNEDKNEACPSCGEDLGLDDFDNEVYINDECSEFGKSPFVKNAEDIVYLEQDFIEEEMSTDNNDLLEED